MLLSYLLNVQNECNTCLLGMNLGNHYIKKYIPSTVQEISVFSTNLLCNQCMTDDIAILFLFTKIDACIVESKFYWYIFNFSPSTNTFRKHFVSSISLESISKFSLLIQHFLFINLVGAFQN